MAFLYQKMFRLATEIIKFVHFILNLLNMDMEKSLKPLYFVLPEHGCSRTKHTTASSGLIFC